MNDESTTPTAGIDVPVPAYMVRIRNDIRTAESKADESMLAKLKAMGSILHARQTEDMPAPHVGQEAIIRLGRALECDIRAQNDLFRSHNALVDAKTLITGMPGHDDTKVFAIDESGRQAVA